MKKIVLITLVLFFVTCKKKPKDWTCTCTIHYTTGDATITEQISGEKGKNEADTECSEYAHNNGGHNNPFDCEVK